MNKYFLFFCQSLNKSYVLVMFFFLMTNSLVSFSQVGPGCELPIAEQQSTDPTLETYCSYDVPLDDHVFYIIIASIAFGLYKIKKEYKIKSQLRLE